MSFIPNSFQIANALVDDGMLAKMKGSALALYIIIVRKTRGWNKEMDSISLSQFQKFSGYGKDAVLAGLDRLIELGLIIKATDGQKTSKYMLNDLSEKPTSEESSLSEKTTRLVGKTDKILSEKPTHNNNIKTTNTKTIDICSEPAKKTRSVSEKSKRFSFEKSLLKLGANKQFVSEFMEVRKAKRAVDSETAFKRFISEQQKSGKSLDEVLELCIVNSWKSFNASWNQPPVAKQQPEAPKRR
ncbi:replication protein, partial [Acinetobacter pollinis]|uniref:replication protein n=1 Tax=Acinetobacter pollinis TaxID=2605270 RepID=UPI0018A33913